jgi:hypothetical protein
MELDSSLQVSSNLLQTQKFDAFIAVSGYESRSIYLANQIPFNNIPNKLVLAFNEKNELLYRELNNKKYTELGFKFINISASDVSQLPNFMDDLCEKIGKTTLDLLIDYSCMPKIWYSELINYFINREDELSCVNLWFSYSPSEYTRSIGSISNKYLDPIKPNTTSDKPVALLLGLGYEKGRAEEIAKVFKAKVSYAFYANSSTDSRYVQEVLDNNKSVLKNINQDQIITYPINDLNTINESLTQLCIRLRMDHQVFIVPVGPKPFSLMSFILSARYPDIKICRVSSVISSSASDHRPHGELLLYKVTFTNEELDY